MLFRMIQVFSVGSHIRDFFSFFFKNLFLTLSLFSQLFGENDPDDDVSPEMDSMESLPTVSENSSTDNASTNGHHTTKENSANGSSQHIEQPKIHLNTRQLAENNGYEPKHLFDKVFLKLMKYLKPQNIFLLLLF